MSTSIAQRAGAAAVIGAVAALAPIAVVSRADAATIHVCVKKSTGAMRQVSAAARCKHGERKLSWNSQGTAGKNGLPGAGGANGAPGASGAPGSNGAIAAYSAFEETPVPLEAVVVSKTLPAGRWAIFAGADVFARASTTGRLVLGCELDEAAHSVDFSTAYMPLLEREPGKFRAETAVSTQAAVTLSSPTTFELRCFGLHGVGTIEEIAAQEGSLLAVEVNSLS
jgi:hypothetical protein